MQRSKATQVAVATDTKPPASLLDSLLGPAKEAAKLYAVLSAKTLAMGSAHHSAWKAAMKRGAPYYAVGRNCFATPTAQPAQYVKCQALDLE
jgi:hypothetical protein